MILAWASAIALAGGYYDPSEVAARSLSFARASEAMMPPFEHAETAASGMAGALREWEEAIDLLGDRAPAGEREALDGARTTFFRERAVLARFAVEQAEGFDQLFRDAIERAVNGRALSACTPRSGLRMAPGRNPEVRCAGEDHTAEVVSHVDGDARLAAGIDALLGRSWPELRVEITPLPMTEGAPVFVGSFFHRAVPDQLGDIDRADAEARLPFEAAIEAGASKEELASLRGAAATVDRTTAERRAALAAPLLDAVDAARARAAKRGDDLGAWCTRPDAIGGCSGPGATAPLVALLADPKVAAAIRKATR